MLLGLLLGVQLGSTDGFVLDSDEGGKLGSTDGELICFPLLIDHCCTLGIDYQNKGIYLRSFSLML